MTSEQLAARMVADEIEQYAPRFSQVNAGGSKYLVYIKDRLVGWVEKDHQPMMDTATWWAYRLDGKKAGTARTRSDAAGVLS